MKLMFATDKSITYFYQIVSTLFKNGKILVVNIQGGGYLAVAKQKAFLTFIFPTDNIARLKLVFHKQIVSFHVVKFNIKIALQEVRLNDHRYI